MYTIQQTNIFANWFTALRDARAKAAIILRLDRVRAGHLGDVKTLGNSVFELRLAKECLCNNPYCTPDG